MGSSIISVGSSIISSGHNITGNSDNNSSIVGISLSPRKTESRISYAVAHAVPRQFTPA